MDRYSPGWTADGKKLFLWRGVLVRIDHSPPARGEGFKKFVTRVRVSHQKHIGPDAFSYSYSQLLLLFSASLACISIPSWILSKPAF